MVTQEQIAKKLGISRQLVSFALAGYPQVAPASRKRILATAAKMGYRANVHARALKNSRTGILALWIPDQISSHYTHVARELNRLAKQGKQELIVSEATHGEAGPVWSHVPVDAIFAVDAPQLVRMHLKTPAAHRVPVISMGADCHEKTDSVKVDLRAGSVELMQHLLGTGVKRILHATFHQDDTPGADRRRTYTGAMTAAGLKPEFLCYPLSEQQRPIVRELIRKHIEAHGCPEAIFCHSDDVALGIYRGLCDLKLRVPQDVILAGCDGIPDTEYLECPLTTMVQPVAEMCRTAWQFLEQRLAKPRQPRQLAVLKPRLAIRASSVRA